MIATFSSRDRLLAYRRALPRAPRLERHTVSVRGLAFAVWSSPRAYGDRPLLCINGGLLFGHEILWPALAPLAIDRGLIFYDQRGRGESEVPASGRPARIEDDAADVPALRTALGIRSWDILGHSWGGGIAMLAAERDRGATGSLILVDSVGATSSWMSGLHERALSRLGPTARAVLQQHNPGLLHEANAAAHSSYARAMYPAWFADPQLGQAFMPPLSRSRTGAEVAASLRRDGYEWSGLVRAIEARTLVIQGERDLLPSSTGHELAALIPGSRLELLPGCGHMPFWEAPETFFRIVNSFLTTSLTAARSS